MKINSVLRTAETYPKRLNHISDAPEKLFYLGTLPDHERLHVAIVGTRKPTAYGREVTKALAEGLARRGAVIVSGMALGIDGIAHQGALSVGGTTLAVQGNGLDRLYPASHRALGEAIIHSGGTIVSEWESGTPPLQYRFLVRNRIVSGLADIVIVTEASERSGTMNTVSHALKQGRDVYAVPGNISSPMSRGCNSLIAQGASPIVDVDSFLDEVIPTVDGIKQTPLASNEQEATLLHLIHSGVRDGDELQRKSGLEPATFLETMTMLEIQGQIKPLGGNNWSL